MPNESSTTDPPTESSTTESTTTGLPAESTTTGLPAESTTTGLPAKSSTTGLPAKSSTTRRLIKLTFLIALPLILIPALLPRKVSARKLAGASAGSKAKRSPSALKKGIQRVVDELRTRLSIADPVLVSLVDRNDLVVTVERSQGDSGAFSLLMEAGFLDTLTDGEIEAVIAHELGHVWIFTHHPYLHTEELANQIAMRVVNRETLAEVYEKVWKRTGPRKGDLVYLPSRPSLDPNLDKPKP